MLQGAYTVAMGPNLHHTMLEEATQTLVSLSRCSVLVAGLRHPPLPGQLTTER